MPEKDNKTVNIHIDGESVEAKVETDSNGEIIVTAENGRFLKFPKDSDLKAEVKKHNNANPVD
jgi:hypothetical protein